MKNTETKQMKVTTKVEYKYSKKSGALYEVETVERDKTNVEASGSVKPRITFNKKTLIPNEHLNSSGIITVERENQTNNITDSASLINQDFDENEPNVRRCTVKFDQSRRTVGFDNKKLHKSILPKLRIGVTKNRFRHMVPLKSDINFRPRVRLKRSPIVDPDYSDSSTEGHPFAQRVNLNHTDYFEKGLTSSESGRRYGTTTNDSESEESSRERKVHYKFSRRRSELADQLEPLNPHIKR